MPDAGRVIAGTARSIRLEAPGPGTRPLADRVKQTLFAILEPELRGARFLDLFAGSGAAGIEALSRGAAGAVFVEHDRIAVQIIHANLDRTELAATERDRRPRRRVALAARRRARRRTTHRHRPGRPAVRRPDGALRGRSRRSVRCSRDGAIVVAKHFWRDTPPPRSGC